MGADDDGDQVVPAGCGLDDRHRYPPDGRAVPRGELHAVPAQSGQALTAGDIRIANDSSFGLGGSAWTTDENEQKRSVNDVETGMIHINHFTESTPEVPFGGAEHSGYDREPSHDRSEMGLLVVGSAVGPISERS